jgi:hypothetical protein
VLLGWVEEERLGFFEQVVRGVAVPTVEMPVSSIRAERNRS